MGQVQVLMIVHIIPKKDFKLKQEVEKDQIYKKIKHQVQEVILLINKKSMELPYLELKTKKQLN